MTLARTSTYRFTVDGKDDPKVLELKERIKQYNRAKVWDDPENAVTQKVVLRGRLGKDNPYAPLYRRGGRFYRSSGQSIRPEHASHFDVYVFDVPAYARHAKRDSYSLPTTQEVYRDVIFSEFVTKQLLSFVEYASLKGAELGLEQRDIDFLIRKKAQDLF